MKIIVALLAILVFPIATLYIYKKALNHAIDGQRGDDDDSLI